MFGSEQSAVEPAVDVTVLHAKIGELTLANDFYPVRSGRPVCYRAQSDDRPRSCAAAGRLAVPAELGHRAAETVGTARFAAA